MRNISTIISSTIMTLLLTISAPPVFAQRTPSPFAGTWNIMAKAPDATGAYWLEVKEEGGKLTGMFLNRGGSPVPVNITVENGELQFQMEGRPGGPAGPALRAKIEGGKLVGTIKGRETVEIVGERPYAWGACDANAKHTFGKPVALFDGTSMDAFGVQVKDKPMMWTIEEGVMTNEPHGNNLVSKEQFKDFRINAEYKLSPKGNSGIYLRGRYELQVLDDFGKPTESHGHMSIYARRAPDVNASKPAGEWQAMQATVVGNCVTITLNGQTLHNNVRIPAITGGALDAREDQPGPVMIQGDHEKVWFRKVLVTPIVSRGGAKTQ